MKYVVTYSQRRLNNAILAIIITAKYVLPIVQEEVCCTIAKYLKEDCFIVLH